MGMCVYDFYERGYWDAIQFSYVLDMDTEQLKAWTMGLSDGRKGKGNKKDIFEFEKVFC